MIQKAKFIVNPKILNVNIFRKMDKMVHTNTPSPLPPPRMKIQYLLLSIVVVVVVVVDRSFGWLVFKKKIEIEIEIPSKKVLEIHRGSNILNWTHLYIGQWIHAHSRIGTIFFLFHLMDRRDWEKTLPTVESIIWW